MREVTVKPVTADWDIRTHAEPLTAGTLSQTYANRIYKFAQLLSRDAADAEDLAQDALERALRGLKTFDPAKGEVEGWLWRIVVNASRDAGKIARRRRLVFDRLVDMLSIDMKVVELTERLWADELLQAVRALPPRRRAVIALRFGADLDYRHVGIALGISEAAALMATRRALAELRTRLSHEVLSK